MNILSDFAIKQRKYIPVFPKATGEPTIYIEGYPCEDDKPMAETDFHAEQIVTLSDQLKRYFTISDLIHVGVDSFVYYEEGDTTKCVAPDIYVVFGVEKYPLRRSFYTWSEGAVPRAVIEFLSDSTARQDRTDKVSLYLETIGVSEYFIHQPEMEKPAEFRGWRQGSSGGIVEIEPDVDGSLFSDALNLRLRWEDNHRTHLRLLRPYLPDGTPIPTSAEERHLREAAEARAEEEQYLREVEQRLREAEQHRREAEQHRREAAEAKAEEEQRLREAAEAELERLRAQMANRN